MKYQSFRIPSSMIDWESPDQMFKSSANSETDKRVQSDFRKLCKTHRIVSWNCDSNSVKILFELL